MAAETASAQALITLSCDPELPLENRIELLSYAFAKAVNSDVLKRIVDWDVAHGKVQFVLAAKGFHNMPHGSFDASMEDIGIEIALEAV